MAEKRDKSFLGTGTAYPVSIDPTTGRFKMSSYEDSVRESIYIILMTQQMEKAGFWQQHNELCIHGCECDKHKHYGG